MEDSMGMTIEFLRARLLSERSVSRTARQRADELAKRVVELEEQLKLVSLRRKKAENATADVLSILEKHGINEYPEELDSSSDQEGICCESKVGNDFVKEEESSVDLKMRGSHMDEFSGSELECSHVPGRSLSWKSGKDCPQSHEKKYLDSSTRRQNAFASTTSASVKRNVGKSCRQIQRREARSEDEESQIDRSSLASQDTGHKILRGNSEKPDAKISLHSPVSGHFNYQTSVRNASNYLNTYGSGKDMERALEHQAQLIGQYQEEEIAQREWEEKFKEDNSSTPDSSEPGTRSDVTEERDETKAHVPPYPVAAIASEDQNTNLKVEDACITKDPSKSHSSGFQSLSIVDLGCLQDQKLSGMLACELPASDFVFPVASGKQDPPHSGNYNILPSHSHQQHSFSPGSTENQSALIASSGAGTSLCEGDTLGSKNEHSSLIPYENHNKVGSVLEALRQAKLSLKDKLNTLPSIDGGASILKSIDYSVGDRPEVPVGCAGLLRVPSDFHIEVTKGVNALGSNYQSSLTNSYLDAGNALTAGDRFISSSYASTGDRHLAIPSCLHMESRFEIPNWELAEYRSRFSSPMPLFGPSLDMGLPYSGRSMYIDPNGNTSLASSVGYASTTYDPFSPDLMPRIRSNEGFRPFSSGRPGVHPANQFSLHDDHIRPNMYRL